MKKRTIVSLGVCALAIGAVAGLVGSRAAKEVVATDFEEGWYITGSAKGSWSADADFKGGTESEKTDVAIWRNVTFAENETFCLAYWHPEYTSENKFDWGGAKRWAAKGTETVTGFADAEDGDHNFKCVTAGTYDVFLNSEWKVYIAASEAATSSEVVTPVYYVRGTAVGGWDPVEANKLSPHEGDIGAILNLNMSVGDFQIGDATWTKQWGWEYDSHVTVIGGAKDNFEKASESNDIHCKVAAAYDIYLTTTNYISIELHGETPEPPEPLEGNFFVSTGNYGMGSKAYLYTWNSDSDKNADFPGEEINLDNFPTASVTGGTNFNEIGGIWEIPASVLKAKFIITIDEAEYDGTEATAAKRHKTGDLTAAANIFVAPEATAEAVAASAGLATQAKLAKDIEGAIWAATDHSVCMVAQATAQGLVTRYDALTDKAAINNSTYYTYDGTKSYSEVKSLAEPGKTDIDYTDIIDQLRVIAGQNAGAWNVNGVSNSVTLIITVSVVFAGIVAAGAMYLISKKRRLQK